MFRIGLISYLMLATLTGPALCCCTATQLASLFGHAERPGNKPQPSCCHQRPSPRDGSQDTDAKKQPSKSQQPQAPSCPCKQRTSEPVLVFPPGTLSAKQLGASALPQDFVQILAFLHPAAVTAAAEGLPKCGESSTFPYLTGQDILRALHILRC